MVNVGDKSEMSRVISESDVEAFAQVSGDHNPIHLDKEISSRGFFGRRIVHGMFGASLISSLISNDLPGEGTIYLSQNLNFLSPIHIGDEVITRIEVTNIIGRKIILTTSCIVGGKVAISGEAVVSILENFYEN